MTPAVVVGSGLGALGALRLLRRAGIPAYSLPAVPSHESRSRWARPLPGTRATLADSPLAEILAACSLERAALIPCSDAVLGAISLLPVPLAARFPSSTPAPAAVAQLTRKDKFASLLRSLEIAHPTTLIIDDPQDLERFADMPFTHLFLKPVDSASFMRSYGVKGCRVRDMDDARRQLGKVHGDGHRVVVQEYVPGPGCNHYLIDGFVDAGGTVRALFARRRLRMFPPDFGDSTHMVSVALSEVEPAVEALRKILAAVRYRGIFSGEFKRDERDGLFKILEVNARVWIYVEFAGRCGVDVCTMSYRDALGLPVIEQVHYRTGVRLVSPYLDLAAVRYAWRKGEMTGGAWLRSWAGAQQPTFNLSDPLPAVADWYDVSRKLLRRALRGGPDAP
jgi:predicted ATP-grasp superfamily ATP-dependent carboligase